MTTSQLYLANTFVGPYKVDLPETELRRIVDSEDGLESGPLIFEIRATSGGSSTTTKSIKLGVREFSTDEDTFSLNAHAAEFLGLEIGDPVEITRIHLPKGTQITLKPLSSKSESIDWKSLLEAWIPKNYTALSLQDRIVIPYLGINHELLVTHLEPHNDSVCVVDTDMDLIIDSGSKPISTSLPSASPSNGGSNIVISGDAHDHDHENVPNHSNNDIRESSEPLRLELNKTYDLANETLLTSEGLGVDKFYVSCSQLAFVGPEHATSPASFIAAVTDFEPTEVSTALLGAHFSILASGTLYVSTTKESTEGAPPGPSSEPVCEFCGKHIPQQSYVLHTSFCRRNSSQCPICSRKFGGTTEVPESHLKLHDIQSTANNGGGGECECGEFSGDSLASLAFHRATTCPLRPHICQFCHLLVPQGETSPVDAMLGLSGHEAQCGNRTTDCPLCNRPIRLRNLGLHLKEHDEKRKERKPPTLCANQNCPNPLQDPSPLTGLCATCFGPLSVPGKNNDAARIRKSMERRYVLQMNQGCKKSWCQNEYCATNNKRSIAEAIQEAHQILNREDGKHWFCVDEIRTRKAMFVQLEGEYARGWRGLAISTCSSEAEAQQWLQTNASRLNE